MYHRDNLLNDLRKFVIEVVFTKVNGEQRVMHCSLRPDLLPETYKTDISEEKDFHQKNSDVIAAWDVQKGGWRSFRIDSVTYVQDVTHKYA
jgi:hypothetical protein